MMQFMTAYTLKTLVSKIFRAILNRLQSDRITESQQNKKFLKVIEASQYFDPEWYLNRNPDVRNAGMNPAEHYLLYGWKEGRCPGPEFDSNAYLDINPDVREAGMCPLLHYELYGRKEKRNIRSPAAPVPKQEEEFSRFKKIIDRSSFFDPEWYLEENPDVRAAGMAPAEHYLRSGWREGRNPGPEFCSSSYLIANIDVWQAGICPLLHYELTGRKEKRKIFVSSDTEASERRIEHYWTCHKKCKKAVYTCILGEDEHLITHHFISDDWDYVCFTNNPALLSMKAYGAWRIVPPAFTSTDRVEARAWHMLHPQELFPEYEESIWLDSHINIQTDHLFSMLENTDEDFLLPLTPKDSGSYGGLQAIASGEEDSARSLPADLILPDTRLIYIRHRSESVTKLMNRWCALAGRHPGHEDACLAYIFWKSQTNISPHLMPELGTDKKNFRINDTYQYDHAYSLLQIQKYKKAIDGHKVISFDIFDTLLVRPYLFPKDLFLHLENIEHRPGFADARVQAEIDARAEGKHVGDITLEMIYWHIEEKYRDLKEKEKALEFQVCQPHPIVKELYDYALKQEKKIIAVSDMYLSKEFISKLLSKSGYDSIDRIFVSSAEHARKDTGKLYEAVLNELGCSPSDVLHIGDNPAADGEKSALYGIQSLIIEKVREHLFNTNAKTKALPQVYQNKLELSIYLGILAVHSAKIQEYQTKQEYFENLGYEYGGIIAYQFVKFICEDCLKSRIKDIAMVSRDGYTLQRVFELLNRNGLNSHYVYAPRSLCHVISGRFDHSNKDYLDDFTGYYREALYSEKYEPHKYSENDNLRFIEKNEEQIKSLAKRKKAEYLSYLKQFSYSSPKLAVVDLVTTSYAPQRLFEEIYPDKEITGYYWRINQTAKFDKNARAFDQKGESLHVLEPWGFMQFIFTAPEFPLKDFVKGKPVYKNTDNENERYIVSSYPYISDGIVNFVRDLKAFFGETDIDSSPLLPAYLIKTLNMNPSEIDRKFIGKGGGNLSSYGISNSDYMSLFRTW